MIGTVVVDPLQDKNVGSYLSSHIFLMVKINKSNTTGATSGTETAHSSDLNSHPLLVGSFCLIFDFPCNILATIVLCFRPFSFGQFIVCPSVYGSDWYLQRFFLKYIRPQVNPLPSYIYMFYCLLTCSCHGYKWKIAHLTLNNNKSINQAINWSIDGTRSQLLEPQSRKWQISIKPNKRCLCERYNVPKCL